MTWIQPAAAVDLPERGIDSAQAAGLRRRLATFAEDWDRPEMAAYDDFRRVALVVQADGSDFGLSQTIVAMVTSNMARAAYPR